MSDEIKALRRFLGETRAKAQEVASVSHLGADAKSVIEDLLTISGSLEGVLDQNSGQSADTRVLKKKLDAAKAEHRGLESKAASAKQLLVEMVEEVKTINAEVVQILKRHEAAPQNPDAVSAQKIRAAIQKMVEVVKKSSEK